MSPLQTPIEYLKGVGPQRATLLQRELDIYTFEDLLLYFPFRHVDASTVCRISQIDPEAPMVRLQGRLSHLSENGVGRTLRLNALFSDESGTIELVWFKGIKWVKESLRPGADYILMGKPSLFNGHINIAHPELELLSHAKPQHPFIPIYSSSEKLKAKWLNAKGIASLTEVVLQQCKGHIPEVLPPYVVEHYQLPSRADALRMMHYPDSQQEASWAAQRMKFEELFFLQLTTQHAKLERKASSVGRIFPRVGDLFNHFYNDHLPFQLTGAQKRVVKEIREDMRSGHQMNRLVQGDVGSGKTLVALLCMLLALDNGCQACMMAPTEILAHQHHASFLRFLEGMDIKVELLVGSLKASQKKKIKQRLADGDIDIMIGTHALIEPDVVFKQLGLVVIDEQHRFGVEQRSKLWAKNEIAPHVLVMTATPIPRTLAMTVYGDLDCSIIDELPPGRQPIKTIHSNDHQRLKVFAFMREQIKQGRQVYVVYPLIEESEKLDLKDLMDGYESIARDFPLPDYQISIVHGRMPAEDKDYEMKRFKDGITHIMVSTTVIEVGVDVPNATVMVIENAERFGLSQLHQLRGRVGRGGGQSYCILMTKDDLSSTARERIRTMVESTDGFRIAEADLQLRGPGDIEGLQQSGDMPLRIADLVADEPIVRAAHDTVENILAADPTLANPIHSTLRTFLAQNKPRQDWGKIS